MKNSKRRKKLKVKLVRTSISLPESLMNVLNEHRVNISELVTKRLRKPVKDLIKKGPVEHDL